jgi:hypothetical protein
VQLSRGCSSEVDQGENVRICEMENGNDLRFDFEND